MKKTTLHLLQNLLKRVPILLLSVIFTLNLRAQVVINENFDTYNGTLPMGWVWNNLTGSSENSNKWLDRNNTLPVVPNPVPIAFSGSNYLFYNTIGSVAGEQAYLTTKSFDLSGRGASPANISFYMYRDNGSALADSITILVGNSPLLSSATRLGVMQRNNAAAPAATANTWNQYTFALPASINTSHTYVFFLGTSRVGRDILIDNFSIDTWPSAMTYSSTTMWNQGIQIVSKAGVNEAIVGIQIVTNNSGTPLNLYRITFNSNGCSNALTDVQNAKLWYTGQTNVYSNRTPLTNQVGAIFSPVNPGSKIVFMNPGASPAPLITLTNDTNYFWLSYDIKATATPNNLLDAEFDSVVVGTTFAGAVYSAPGVATLPGSVLIDPYCIPSSSTACVACYCQGVYLAGANSSKITTGSSSLAVPVNTGAMVNGTLYCFWPCIAPPLGTTLRYKLWPPVTNQTATLNTGVSYPLKLQYGQITGNIGAWIDYNNDYDFDDTLFFGGIQYYERLGYRSTTGTIVGCTGGGCTVVGGNTNSQNLTITFTVPPTGTPGLVYGNHRLRIREVSLFTGTITPCTSYGHGECEDYTITIIPACTAGLCQWLGYTDDWNTPSNWCPNVPTINDVARVDFSYSFTPPANYYKPKIKAGVAATCKVLRIANTDTVYITAPKYDEAAGTGLAANASLTIADSMRINYNTASGTGAFIVNATKADSAQASSGTYGFIAITPFQSSRINNRMQLVYTKAELNSYGLIEGDVIDSLVFYIRALSSAASDSFKLFTIQVANLSTPGWGWPPVPVSWAPTGPFTTIFNSSTLDVRNPQATHPNAVPAVTAANKGQLSLVTNPNSFVWDGVSDIVLDICYSNRPAAGLPANSVQLSQSQTTGRRSVCWANNVNNSAAAALCGVNFPLPTGYGTLAFASDYRPNITFKYHRPYNKPVISMASDFGSPGGYWVNNGSFVAGRSEVKFTGTVNNQEITGANVTTFADLTIDQNNGKVIMQKDVYVDSVLNFSAGELTLNRNLLGVNYGFSGAVIRSNGWVNSEDLPPGNYSRMYRNVGIGPGTYLYPFGINASTYLPFTYSPSGDAGIVTVSTYKTATNNTPYPVISGPYTIGVNHMNSQASGTDISVSDVVDRFWQINKTGASNNATLMFSYKPTSAPAGEEPPSTPFTYVAQRFQVPGGSGAIMGGWANLGGANGVGTVTAVLNADPINGPWTLGNFSNPLPVELINFDAKLVGDKVKTYWSIASESDNDYFIVERTTDLNEYDFIARVESKGNASSVREYEAYDYKPLMGLQYYRLKTIGINGNEELSKIVPVKINNGSLFYINFIATNSENKTMMVSMRYNSQLPYSVKLTNVFGQVVYYRENYKGVDGIQVIDLNNIIQTKGVYFIELENSQEKTSKKFVY